MSYIISICANNSEISELQNYYSSFPSSMTNNLTFNFSEGKYYKVLFADKLVGFASVIDEDYSFVDLKRYIHPEHRNKGVGGALLDFIIQDAKKLGKTRITGSFLGNNEKVANFFKSKDFNVTTGKDFSMVLLSLK